MNRCLICGKGKVTDRSRYHVGCAEKLFGSVAIPVLGYTWDELNQLAVRIIERQVSVPGVQPKLSLHLDKQDDGSDMRLTIIGLEGDFILKPPSARYPYLPEAEHFCMSFARKVKITTAEFGLIPLKSGEMAYITKRMDRCRDGMLHMEDFCQLTGNQTEHKYRGSMEKIGKKIREYSSVPGLDAGLFFDLTVFSFLTGNSDMHLKKFSLLRLQNDILKLAPAYDLVPVKIILPEDAEEMALNLNGKKSRLNRRDFEVFGHTIKMTDSQIKKSISRLLDLCRASVDETLESSFLPKRMQNDFLALFMSRIQRLAE